MKLRVALVAFGAVLALSSAANAAVVNATGSGAGFLSNPFGDPEATFEGLPLTSPPTSSTPFSSGPASFTQVTGTSHIQAPPTTPGVFAAPAGDPTQYYSVQGSSSVDVTFGGQFSRLGLYWGSIDTYNRIEFYRGATLIDTVLGQTAALAAVDPGNANGDQAAAANNKFVVITLVGDLGGFDRIRLISDSNSFEIDNLAAGGPPSDVPVPMALPLFAAGLGVIGLISRRRKRAAA